MAALEREKDVVVWFDGDIEPGREITPEIRKQLRQTDIFLALGSSNYLHSDYCYRREYKVMLRRSKQGRPRVLVALVGICDWPSTEMAKSKMLPDDAKSVEEHGRPNRAYLQIVQGLRRVVRAVRQEKGKEQAEADRKVVAKARATAASRRNSKGRAVESAQSQAETRKPAAKVQKPKTRPAAKPRNMETGRKPKGASAPAKPRTTSRTSKPRRPAK